MKKRKEMKGEGDTKREGINYTEQSIGNEMSYFLALGCIAPIVNQFKA